MGVQCIVCGLTLWGTCTVYCLMCDIVGQVYSVLVIRKQIPRYVRLQDRAAVRRYECPLSLSVLYQPVSTLCGGHTTGTYSAPLIDVLTRTDHVDPLSEQALDVHWRSPRYDVDAQLTAANACITFADGGNWLHHVTVSAVCRE